MMDNKSTSDISKSPTEAENIEAQQSDHDDAPKSNTEVQKDLSDVSPELLEKIKSQVEFYFSDVNMQRDKFLIGQTKLDDGWIPMTIMLQFKMLASLCSDVDVILKAIESSDLMEISENRTKIRRRLDKPLPLYNEEYRKAQLARTIYVKEFPRNLGIQELKDFFKDFGAIENIIMRKYKDENKKLQFKGSIFAQFESLEKAKEFVDLPSVKFRDVELVRKFSEEYSYEKNKDRQSRKNKSDGSEKIIKKTKKEEMNENKTDTEWKFPKGTILEMTTESNDLLWEEIKEAFVNINKPQYVDYDNGAAKGWIRFSSENDAYQVLEKIKDHKIKIKDADVTFRILEGAEEDTYMTKVISEQNNSRQIKFLKYRNKKGAKRGKKRFASSIFASSPAKKSAA